MRTPFGSGLLAVPGAHLTGFRADVHLFALSSEQAQHFDGLVTGAAEPVRHLGVELGHFTGTKDQIVVSQDQSHATGQDA